MMHLRCQGFSWWIQVFNSTLIEYNLWQRSISTYILKEKSTIKTLVCSIFTPHFNFTYSWHFLFLFIYHQFMLIFFAFDNDDMESSKRRVTFLSLICLLKYNLVICKRNICKVDEILLCIYLFVFLLWSSVIFCRY